MKVPFTAVHGSVRFSFSRYTTDAEVDRIIEVFPEIVAQPASALALLGRRRRPAPPRGAVDDGARGLTRPARPAPCLGDPR